MVHQLQIAHSAKQKNKKNDNTKTDENKSSLKIIATWIRWAFFAHSSASRKQNIKSEKLECANYKRDWMERQENETFIRTSIIIEINETIENMMLKNTSFFIAQTHQA
ncbi:hypothetical protein [Hafnia alvei]|uniref:hypothetical protein n=1 Tax=Hafnia alvei TaxID=569 RepID=UPI001E337167|nr:hypothetical protein [Hafnia alvei]